MSKKNISVGIDIGTQNIKVMVAEKNKDENKLPTIIGTGFTESKGLRYGYIINSNDVMRVLEKAVSQAEKASGIKIKKACISIGGISLDSIVSSGSTIISRGDNEITDMDVKKATEASENNIPQSEITNRKIIHAIPLGFKIDEKAVLGRPVGMKGIKLEVKTLFVTSLEQHMQDLIQAIDDSGIEVEDIVAAPMAASIVSLSKAQKIAGVVLANIGSETVSIIVYDNNIPVSIKVLPIGSTDITNDIALGLKIPLEEAEQIKTGGIIGSDFSKKKLDEIITARMTDIFELIESHLKKIKKSGLLPAGIVITGGGSGITTIEDLAKAILRLPSKIAKADYPTNNSRQVKNSLWSVAYGLCVLGLTGDEENPPGHASKRLRDIFFAWIKQFFP